MAFEEIKARIALLVEEMVQRPTDAHEIHETLREQLNELRAMGMPLPDDLVALERRLEADFDS
ncbi:hypothetical protein [Phyllobacterium endophyticum]|jgi:hypothetical protein|uniref:DUF4404 domain-containing protein n=1 Tax=Phyllobacterium endophyticum TaxID=1149773 RepID=A0A2P7B072_9HYPH|nr:hypothetical protein [Phyllobacterium endophyticum]MBB3235479.1 uncharacterized coiled-coil DUF342 family protein [Phyllobacterium endophyticum]PSH59877.1 hypothetical protein CU100_03730 [Phyllobacterium endophyticum]TXR50102.1 hypothetical protein FVA77_06880 [Phyllobacterium endophyticum]TYR42027.1 hypothetical protein FY050_12330 [Phyllobacterium endophyticum]